MKKLLLLFIAVLAMVYSQENLYSQSGWFWQNPLPANLNFTKVDFINNETGFVNGMLYIIKTTDRGNTWYCISDRQSFYQSSFSDIDFINESTGFGIGQYSKIQKTTNNCQNWSIKIDHPYWQPNPKIYFINDETGYAAVGYNNMDNLFRTTNGGENWIHPSIAYLTLPDITSIYFCDTNTGYATAGLYSIIKTIDQGISWASISVNFSYFFQSIYFTNFNTGYLAGGVYNSLWERILKSTNGGFSWIEQTAPLRKAYLYDIKFINVNSGFIVADSGIMVKTTNAGSNWSLQQLPTNASLKNIFFLDFNTAIIVGSQGTILKTTNQGGNFIFKKFRNDDALNTLCFTDSLTGYAAGNNGLIMKDSCGYWFKIYSDVNSNYKSIYFNNNTTGYCCGDNGEILKTTNGGLNWFSLQTNTSLKLNNIRFINLNTGFVVGNSGKIIKTTNAGKNWNSITAGTNLNLNKIISLDSILYIVGDSGLFLKSTDLAINWEVRNTGISNNLKSLSLINTDIIFSVGDNSLLIKSTNSGNTWQRIKLPLYTFGLKDIIFVDSYTGYISGDGGKILKTTNSGLNWGFQYSGVNNNLNALSFINPAIGYVVGDSGVIRNTTNGGGNITIGIKGSEETITSFSLSQNYPNPFNPSTTIKFSLPNPSKGGAMNVKIVIYDILGREVQQLLNEEKKPGSYEITWDGSSFASGIYFYKIMTDDFIESKKMVLMK